MAVFVLDTSALLSGAPPSPSLGTLLLPQGVLSEMAREGRDRRALDYLLETGLKVMAVDPEALAEAREAARKTGDLPRMSEVDLEVLAAAIAHGGTILTDDYRIQNVATTLGIASRGHAQRGIREVREWTWVHRCKGCKRTYPEARAECDVCGSEVRTSRAR